MNSARVGLLHSSAINHIWNWTHQWTWWPLGRSRRGFDSNDRRSGSACSVCCRSPQTHLASLVSRSGCTENQKPLYEPPGVGCLFAESEISRVDARMTFWFSAASQRPFWWMKVQGSATPNICPAGRIDCTGRRLYAQSLPRAMAFPAKNAPWHLIWAVINCGNILVEYHLAINHCFRKGKKRIA